MNAPIVFSPAQLRVLLRAIVNLDPYTFADDLADDLAGEIENEQRTDDDVLLSTIDTLTDDKLTAFAIRLVFAGHRGLAREGEFDFLAEAETVFAPTPPKKRAAAKKVEQATLIESPAKGTPKSKMQRVSATEKKIAA